MALSSLIALSKYLGRYDEFKQRIRNFGLKWSGRSNYDCFRRIWNNDAADIPEWLQECSQWFDPTYATFIKFCAISGLRKSEAINAFNLVLKLREQGRVNEYYNAKLEALEHYHYPELFLRKSKNTYLSFIPIEFLKDILECQPVSNVNLKRRFKSHNMKCRLQHLRHHWATQTIQNGLLREEADLLQGRIGRSVFMQHYFSPNIQELKSRTLRIVRQTILRSDYGATLGREESQEAS